MLGRWWALPYRCKALVGRQFPGFLPVESQLGAMYDLESSADIQRLWWMVPEHFEQPSVLYIKEEQEEQIFGRCSLVSLLSHPSLEAFPACPALPCHGLVAEDPFSRCRWLTQPFGHLLCSQVLGMPPFTTLKSTATPSSSWRGGSQPMDGHESVLLDPFVHASG